MEKEVIGILNIHIYGFISCSKKVTDYDGDKESFVGQYGSIEKSCWIIRKKFKKKVGKWNDSIAVVKTEIELKPNKTENVNFFIGIKENKNEIEVH